MLKPSDTTQTITLKELLSAGEGEPMKDCIGTTRYLMGKYPVEIVKCGEADFGEYVDECPEQQNCLRAKILQDCTITLMAVDYDEDGPKPDLVPLPDTLRKGEIRCFPAMWLHKKSSLKPISTEKK